MVDLFISEITDDTEKVNDAEETVVDGAFTEEEFDEYYDENGLSINIENFSGPLDLLLQLVNAAKIEIKDIYVEEREVVDEETGELKKKYRTILFDASGQTYATGSYGIYNIIKKIVTIYGLPETWANPLKVKVAKRPIGNGKQSLTLTLV